jgi:hypothetical protein
MNPIIKTLAEQAGMNIKTNVIGTALVFGTFEGYKTSHISVEELEKFAELIVRECAELSTGYIGNIKLLICNHFGIEPGKK